MDGSMGGKIAQLEKRIAALESTPEYAALVNEIKSDVQEIKDRLSLIEAALAPKEKEK